MAELKQKISIFNQLEYALVGTKNYPKLQQQTKGGHIKFFFVSIIIMMLLNGLIPILGVLFGIGGISNYMKQSVPDFKLENQQLTMDKKISYEDKSGGIYFAVDAKKDHFTSKDLKEGFASQIIIGKNGVLLNNYGMSTEYKFSDFGDITFDKKDLVALSPIIYCAIPVFLIINLFVQAVYLGFNVLLFTVVGYISNMLNVVQLPFKTIALNAMYAMLIGSIIQAVNSTGDLVSPTLGNIIGVLLSAFYFFTANAKMAKKIKAGV